MIREIAPLLVIILALLIYLGYRWRYRFTCPHCGSSARARMKVVFNQIDQKGKRHKVTVPAAGCDSCDHFWTLKNTHVRTTGVIIPKGTQMRRP